MGGATPQAPQPTPQPIQPNPVSGIDEAPKDPSILAFVKALGQAESGGNYNAVGDNGNSHGAFQMSQGFIGKWAPTILGNTYAPGQPLSMEQQNKLAYNAVKIMKTKGDPAYQADGPLTGAQIASAWNAGDPNAYLDPEFGKNNQYGSTNNYVNKVNEFYQKNLGQSDIPQLKSSQPTTPTAQTDQGQPWWQKGLEFLFAPALVSTALGVQNAGNLKPLAGPAITAGATAIGFGPEAASLAGAFGGDAIGGSGSTPAAGSSESSGGINSIGSSVLANELNKSGQASGHLYDKYIQMLGGTIQGRQEQNDPVSQDALKTASLFGLAPEIDENGSMNMKPSIDKADKTISDLSQKTQNWLLAEGGSAPIEFAKNEAKQQLRKTTPSTDWEEGDKAIDEFANSYKSNFGRGSDNLKLSDFQRMKSELGHGKKWGVLESTAKKRAAKALSFGARRTIEEHTQHKELYNRTMKIERDLINFKGIAKHRLNGRRAAKNEGVLKQLLHSGGRYAALYIGDKIGGPMGAILGSMMGDYITKSIDKRYGKTIFETPAMRTAIHELKDHAPLAYQRLLEELRKAGISYPSSAKRKPHPERRISRDQSHKAKQDHRQSKESHKESSQSKSRK